MTPDEVRALLPRQADLLAAELVFRWRRLQNVKVGQITIDDAWLVPMLDGSHLLIPVSETPALSTDKTQAYLLADAMLRQGYDVVIRQLQPFVAPTEDAPGQPEIWGAAFAPKRLEADQVIAPAAFYQSNTAQDAMLRGALVTVTGGAL